MAIAERRGFRRRGRRFLAAALFLAFTTAEPSAVCAVICSITDGGHGGGKAMVMDDMPCHAGTTAVHAPQVPTGMLSVALHSAPPAFVPPDVPRAHAWVAPRPTSAAPPEILPPPPRA